MSYNYQYIIAAVLPSTAVIYDGAVFLLPKCAVLIDGAYLGKILKDRGGLRVHLQKLAVKLAIEGQIVRTYYYHCMPYQSHPPTADERERYAKMHRFVYSLQRYPRFEVRLGRLSKTYDEHGNVDFVQKRVDVLMAVDLVRMSWGKQIDYAYLLTGDSDEVPAIRAAKEAGVDVGLFYAEGTANDELLQIVDEEYLMESDFFDDCLM